MMKRTGPESRAFEMFRQANPADVEELRLEPRESAWVAVGERILAELRTQPTAGASHPRATSARPARPRLMRLAAAGGAIALLLAAVPALLPGEKQPRTGVQLLEAAAATAAAQPSLTPRPGEYLYVRERSIESEHREVEGRSRNATVAREWWIAADGAGRIVERRRGSLNDVPQLGRSEPSSASLCLTPERPVQGVDPAQPPSGLKICVQNTAPVIDARFADGRFAHLYQERSPSVLGRQRVDSLPTDPDALQRALEGELAGANSDDPDLDTGFRPGSGVPREEQLLILIAQTLSHPLASPELRGALFEVATRLDRVKVTQGVKDPAGRPATSVTLQRSAIRYAIFFDPATSEVLATGHVAYDPGLTYSDYTLYLKRGTVNSVSERP